MLSVLSLINPIFEKTFTGHSLPQQLAISRALCSQLWLQGLLSSLCLCGSWQRGEILVPCGCQGLCAGGAGAAPWCELEWDLGSGICSSSPSQAWERLTKVKFPAGNLKSVFGSQQLPVCCVCRAPGGLQPSSMAWPCPRATTQP